MNNPVLEEAFYANKNLYFHRCCKELKDSYVVKKAPNGAISKMNNPY